MQTIQALRAIAALLVVWVHSEDLMARLYPHTATLSRGLSPKGAFGVDLFFVISGVVMTVTCEQAFGRPEARLPFLERRVTRIYPTYWLYTTAMLAIVLLAGSRPEPRYLLDSYLLLPVLNAAGRLRPLLGVGWTLSYEIYFYALFALVLAWPKWRALSMLSLLLLAIGAAARVSSSAGSALSAFLSDFIVLEFAAGAILGGLRGRLQTWPRWSSQLLLSAGALWWAFTIDPAQDQRPLVWGPAAVLLVMAALVWEGRARVVAIPVPLSKLGDASYSLYLLHPVLFTALSPIGTRVAWPVWLPSEVGVVVLVLLAAVLCWPAYFLAELPLLRAVRHLFHRKTETRKTVVPSPAATRALPASGSAPTSPAASCSTSRPRC